jgi:hypothetical protein
MITLRKANWKKYYETKFLNNIILKDEIENNRMMKLKKNKKI